MNPEPQTTTEIQNAVITHADLNIEQEFLTLSLCVSYGVGCQCIPTYVLHLPHDWSHYKKEGVAGEMILRLLEIAEVKKFSELEGRNIRVEGNDHGIIGIGHILNEDWFHFAELQTKKGEEP